MGRTGPSLTRPGVSMFDALRRMLGSVAKDRHGLETLEYAVFAVAFVIAIGGVVGQLKTTMTTAYSDIGTWIATQATKM